MIDPTDFKQYLTIDKTNLDNELVQQSQLFFEVSEAFTEAVDQRDSLKEELAVVDAELDFEIRRDHEISGDRYSEASVKSGIKTHKKHMAAYDAYADAKKLADRLSALKESFIQRSHALKHLCELFVANYFESNSFRGTDRSDTAVYMQRRERMAAGRETRKGK